MKFTAIIALASAVLFTTTVDARFGQENAVGLGGKLQGPACLGQDPKNLDRGFQGQEISLILAAADPCAKIEMADDLVARAKKSCANDAKGLEQAIKAAMDLVVAEKNFNPFNGNLDSVCTNPNLPAQPELRGLIQKVDPRTAGPNNNDQALNAKAQAANAKSEQVLAAAKAANKGPGAGNGLSMADVLFGTGFDGIAKFTPKAGGAAAPPPPPPAAGNGQQNNNNQGNNNNQNNAGAVAGAAGNAAKIAQAKTLLQQAITLLNDQGAPSLANNNNNNNAGSVGNAGNAGNNAGNTGNAGNATPPPATPPPATAPAAAAGQCADVRKMDFVVNGREHRFGIDGTQVALNPAIVVQQICDRANGQCKDICIAAGATLVATGVKGFSGDVADPARDLLNAQAADTFNKALGNPTNVAGKFAGATTGSDAAAVQCTGPKMQFIEKGTESRFGFNGNQVALNPGVVVGQICTNLVKGDGCKAKCEAAGATLVASGARGFSNVEDAAAFAANTAAATNSTLMLALLERLFSLLTIFFSFHLGSHHCQNTH
ncbi:hypothetical protein BC829DRAFT_420117 [Chytridium lagenaria]|nr:hypothetical protein BC829DRAFT_420117 [Chytridium lagenaria]